MTINIDFYVYYLKFLWKVIIILQVRKFIKFKQNLSKAAIYNDIAGDIYNVDNLVFFMVRK